MNLIFNATDVRRVAEHSLNAPKQATTWDGVEVAMPSVLLVHDQGVYLMSNGEPADMITERSRYVAYAHGCHPDTDNNWYDTARELVGGSDFAELLPWAADISALIETGVERIVIDFGDDSITLNF